MCVGDLMNACCASPNCQLYDVILPPTIVVLFVNGTDKLLHETVGVKFANGAAGIVIFMLSVMVVQPLVEVSVKFTEPFAMSDALGVYNAFNVVLFGVNVPVPLVVQIPVVVPPSTDPFN